MKLESEAAAAFLLSCQFQIRFSNLTFARAHNAQHCLIHSAKLNEHDARVEPENRAREGVGEDRVVVRLGLDTLKGARMLVTNSAFIINATREY